MYLGVLEAQNPSKTEPCVTKGVPNRVLGHPRAPQKAALPPTGVPKSIRMACGTPLEHNAGPRRKRDLEGISGYLPFWTFFGAPGRSKGPFWISGGVQKGSKIDMGRQGRHPWGPRWAKRLFQRGSQNGVEKVIEKGSQNESF